MEIVEDKKQEEAAAEDTAEETESNDKKEEKKPAPVKSTLLGKRPLPKTSSKPSNEVKKPEIASKPGKTAKNVPPVVEDKVESKLAPPKKIVGGGIIKKAVGSGSGGGGLAASLAKFKK